MSADRFDVVIIGAGVNGAGLFRDLCEQGVHCFIADKADFGSGTSAAPSRLIHGGLKYLETGEFQLVAQSTLERNLLLRNAPHLVRPLPTLIPIFSWLRGIPAALRTLMRDKSAPRSRGALLIKLGLQIYDYYGARSRVMPRHWMISRDEALRELPALNPAIVAVGGYYDARVTLPERLVYELIADGLASNPNSAAANYMALESHDDGVLTFRDRHGRARQVRPTFVVNAAGPWIDAVNAKLGVGGRMIGGARGSHLLLRHDELVRSLAGRMIYFEADDGRICLVYEYFGLALVGSTDIPDDDPDNVRCDDAEVDYLLQSLASLLPGLGFDRSQIVFAYAGIRPLPVSDAASPGLVSRDHSAPVAPAQDGRPFPVVSMVGGKWTTFRGFAAEVADALLAQLGRARKTSTETLPIGGGRGFPAEGVERDRWIAAAAAETGAAPGRMATLLERYGVTALAIARHAAQYSGDRPLRRLRDFGRAEIDYLARQERVERLTDLVLRRTALAITGAVELSDLEEIAEIAAEALGWSEDRRSAEVEAARRLLEQRHHYRFDPHASARVAATTT